MIANQFYVRVICSTRFIYSVRVKEKYIHVKSVKIESQSRNDRYESMEYTEKLSVDESSSRRINENVEKKFLRKRRRRRRRRRRIFPLESLAVPNKHLARNLSVLCGQGRGTLPQEKAATIDRAYRAERIYYHRYLILSRGGADRS